MTFILFPGEDQAEEAQQGPGGINHNSGEAADKSIGLYFDPELLDDVHDGLALHILEPMSTEIYATGLAAVTM